MQFSLWVSIRLLRRGKSRLSNLGRGAGSKRVGFGILLTASTDGGLINDIYVVTPLDKVRRPSFTIIGRLKPGLRPRQISCSQQL